jgi:surface polysaccharide O-acyltransferase-like enzyme
MSEPATPPVAPAPTLDPALSQKLRFWSLMAMVLLVYVHAFNLHPRYLQAFTQVEEPAAWDTVLQYLIANGLVRFRIPILFAISGYLFAFRDTGDVSHRTRLTKRLRTLGVPYLAWSAIALLVTFALEQFEPTRTWVRNAALSPYQPDAFFVSQYSVGQWVSRWLPDPLAFQLWFLRTLLVLTAIYPWLRTAVTRWPRAYFAVATLLWIPGGGVLFIEFEGLLFYALGVWLAALRVDVMARPRWVKPPVLLSVWLLLCGAKTWMAFNVHSLNFGVWLSMTLMHRAGELAGLLTAWYGLDNVARRAMAQRWVQWVAGFSFMIYAVHVPLVNYVTEAALQYGAAMPHINWWTYVFVPLAVSAFAVLLGAVLRRTALPAYSVLTGGRGL